MAEAKEKYVGKWVVNTETNQLGIVQSVNNTVEGITVRISGALWPEAEIRLATTQEIDDWEQR